MWWVKEGTGISLVIFIYFSILTADLSFMFGAFFDEFKDSTAVAYANLFIFQMLIFLMVWSHSSWMLTSPGVLPQNIEKLDSSKMRKKRSNVYRQLEYKIENLNRGDEALEAPSMFFNFVIECFDNSKKYINLNFVCVT